MDFKLGVRGEKNRLTKQGVPPKGKLSYWGGGCLGNEDTWWINREKAILESRGQKGGENGS